VRAVGVNQNVLVGRWRRARDCPPYQFLRYLLRHPQRYERFAGAAGHDGGKHGRPVRNFFDTPIYNDASPMGYSVLNLRCLVPWCSNFSPILSKAETDLST
jgi:hypothetical protein